MNKEKAPVTLLERDIARLKGLVERELNPLVRQALQYKIAGLERIVGTQER